MEFSEILAAAYEDLGYASSPATADVTRLKRYANEGLLKVLAEPTVKGIMESEIGYSFASVASRRRYSLPDGHTVLRGVRDTTNDRQLLPMTLEDYRRVEQDPTGNTGTPSHYVPLGKVAVALQPSDASELFVDSTSASDTNTAYLEGLITGGYRRTASVSMTGTTAVSLATAITSWIEVTDFYLSAAAVGTVTLHEDADGGTELARITIGRKRPRYTGFLLWPTPAGAYDYVAETRRVVETLVNDTDEPPFDLEFHPMLTDYICYRDWQRKDDSRSESSFGMFREALSRLKYRAASSDGIPVMSARNAVGISRLGGFFPADTVIR